MKILGYAVLMKRATCLFVLALFTPAVYPASISAPTKNVLSLVDSELYAFEMLASVYPLDSTLPQFTLTGTWSAASFTWNSTGTYLGSPLALNATGTYNPSADSLTWTGSGAYAGGSWSLSGQINWLTDGNFQIGHDESISGLSQPYHQYSSDDFGNPAMDQGTTNGDERTEVDQDTVSRSFLFFVFRDKTKVKLGPNDEATITTKLTGASTNIDGKVLSGKGKLDLKGQNFEQTLQITKTPEPSALVLIGLGLAVIGYRRLVWKDR